MLCSFFGLSCSDPNEGENSCIEQWQLDISNVRTQYDLEISSCIGTDGELNSETEVDCLRQAGADFNLNVSQANREFDCCNDPANCGSNEI